MREFAERQGERREGRPARNFRQEIYLRANPVPPKFLAGGSVAARKK